MNDAIHVRAPPPSASLRYAFLYGADGKPAESALRPLANLVVAFPMPGERREARGRYESPAGVVRGGRVGGR